MNHGMVDPEDTENVSIHLTTIVNRVNIADDTDTGLDQLSPDSEYGNLSYFEWIVFN